MDEHRGQRRLHRKVKSKSMPAILIIMRGGRRKSNRVFSAGWGASPFRRDLPESVVLGAFRRIEFNSFRRGEDGGAEAPDEAALSKKVGRLGEEANCKALVKTDDWHYTDFTDSACGMVINRGITVR